MFPENRHPVYNPAKCYHAESNDGDRHHDLRPLGNIAIINIPVEGDHGHIDAIQNNSQNRPDGGDANPDRAAVADSPDK